MRPLNRHGSATTLKTGRPRGGWTLVEMLVTIAVIALLLAPILSAIRTLLVTQQSSTGLLVLARTIGETGRQFARDGEQSSDLRSEGQKLTFVAGATEIVWDWSRGALQRTEQGHSRQTFAFPTGSQIGVQRLEGGLVELRIAVPAPQVGVSGRTVGVQTETGGHSVAPESVYRFVARIGTVKK